MKIDCARKKSTAYIGGTFDLFHFGHVRLLQAAKDVFEIVVVSVNQDEFVTRYKRPPIMTLAERIEVLQSCKFVDAVVINTGDEDSRPAILASGANFIIHGSDWAGPALMKQLGLDQTWLDQNGIAMYYLPYTGGVSTSDIIRRIKQ